MWGKFQIAVVGSGIWKSSNEGPFVKILKAYFDCCFFTLCIPFRIVREDGQGWEVYENVWQKGITYLLLAAVCTIYVKGCSINIREFGAISRQDKVPLSVDNLFMLGKLLADPICSFTWVHLLLRLNTRTSQLLKTLNEGSDTWSKEHPINDPFQQQNSLVRKLKDFGLYLAIISFMIFGGILDIAKSGSETVAGKIFGVDLRVAPFTNFTILVKDIVCGLQYLFEFFLHWCFHIAPITLLLVFTIFLWEMCLNFIASFEIHLQEGQMREALASYVKLKVVSDHVNKIVGPLIVAYTILSIPYFTSFIPRWLSIAPSGLLKECYTGLALMTVFNLGSDLHAKIMNTRSLILAKSSVSNNPMCNEMTGNGASYKIGNAADLGENMANGNLLHNDISTSAVALKGLSFFTVTYSFLGIHFSQCLTYAIIALQSTLSLSPGT